MSGEEFLAKFLDHNDGVTIIDPKRTYAIKAPTKHPIYENFRVEVISICPFILVWTDVLPTLFYFYFLLNASTLCNFFANR